MSSPASIQPQWAAYSNGGGAVSPTPGGSPIPDAEVGSGPRDGIPVERWQRPSATSKRGSVINPGALGASSVDSRGGAAGLLSAGLVSAAAAAAANASSNGQASGAGSMGSFAGFPMNGSAVGSLLTGQDLSTWEQRVEVRAREGLDVSSHKLSMSGSPPALAWAEQQKTRQ